MRRLPALPILPFCLLLAACARLDDAGRPAYHGSLAAALWHLPGIDVAQAPVVGGGVAYALGRPWERWDDASATRLYAVDLRSGKLRWSASTRRSYIVGVAGPTVYLGDLGTQGIYGHDDSGVLDAVDARTGRSKSSAVPRGFVSVAYADGVTYAARGERVVAIAPGGATLWSRALPARGSAGAYVFVAGDAVYVRSLKMSLYDDAYTPWLCAFDRRTGAPRWSLRRGSFAGSLGGVRADERFVFLAVAGPPGSVDPAYVDVIAMTAASGRTVWEHRTAGVCGDGPDLAGSDSVVVCDSSTSPPPGNVFLALNRRTGAVLWRGVTSWTYQSAAAFGRYLVASDRRTHRWMDENGEKSYDGWLTLVDRRSGAEVWRTPVLPLADLTRPAIGGGIAVVAAESYSFGKMLGSREVDGLWAFALPTDGDR